MPAGLNGFSPLVFHPLHHTVTNMEQRSFIISLKVDKSMWPSGHLRQWENHYNCQLGERSGNENHHRYHLYSDPVMKTTENRTTFLFSSSLLLPLLCRCLPPFLPHSCIFFIKVLVEACVSLNLCYQTYISHVLDWTLWSDVMYGLLNSTECLLRRSYYQCY